ncbi:helicase [hot springs metagenome]|uniref:Helicase n=1 Tax=hot springs metagenome TaxID=433727 RepID=A0A5J4L4I2_9ZZZZ
MELNNLKKGSIIRGAYWPEPVEIKLIERVNGLEGYVQIVGSTLNSRTHIDQIISEEEFQRIIIDDRRSIFSEEAWKVFLSLEGLRYRFASLYDPLLAMNTSKVDPLPHQIEAVYGYILKLPRMRFLIADDPGAGKTIMAGLIIKELKLRHLAKRILIVTPGHLKDQWRRELTDRVEETFEVIDRARFDSLYRANVWLKENQIITSIDFAKRDDVLPTLASAHFDLIIVDEAHKMSAYRYGEKIDKSDRYRLGEVLSGITNHLLFLTATPHKGDPENFRLFLDLLEPGFFATNELVLDSIKNKDNPLFIRRIKEDLKDFEGKPLFLPRQVKTISFNLGTDSPLEKELYNELSNYVNSQYNKALLKDRKRNIAFALVILQRRLASSTYALLKSLERRKKRLEELLKGVLDKNRISEAIIDFDSIEDMAEEERWKEEEIWETLSVAENREELQKEIQTIEHLIGLAREIINKEAEIKLKHLKETLYLLKTENNQSSHSNPRSPAFKLLIFTESRDTLEYLQKKIREWGFSVNTIHGGMKLEERIQAEAIFKNETDVMVATEAAGEGINLQFCNLMINYDIPWNPNRLEQRMGRIHRYGQQREVHVFNLVAQDTREGRVLSRLFEKLDEIRQALGSDKVFDVLSEVLYNKNLSQLLIEAAANARSIDDILREIDISVDEEYISQIKENLGETLATRYIDYTRIKEMAQQAREYRLIPEYTENYFKKAFIRTGGRLKDLKNGLISIDSIPYEIKNIAEEEDFKRTYGQILKKYPKITFDKDIAFKTPDAEFVSFGHPLFEAVLTWVERNLKGSLINGSVFYDPDRRLDGYILFYEGEIRDGTGAVAGKRLFSFYNNGEDVIPISPAIIWDLIDGKAGEEKGSDIESLKKDTSIKAISSLEEYKSELLKERNRQSEIKEKYGIKSLEYLIVKLDGELISLHQRKEAGENVDIAVRNKEERKSTYEKALEELKRQVEKEKSLTMTMPRFVGIIRVKPSERVNPAMQSDAEIERIGMEMAMRYERENGRIPEDVSAENLGFDIRSTDKNGNVRYIEVKARAGIGDIALTQNEWFKAQRFKEDYYLYVVFNASESPELFIIQNPTENLKAHERIEMVRYIVKQDDIVTGGLR